MTEEKNWAEKRRNVRVPVSIGVKARRLFPEEGRTVQLSEKEVSDADDDVIPDDWQGDSTISSFTDFMTKIEDGSDPVISYFANSLIKIGEKLDQIIDKLIQGNDGRDIHVIKTIDISGTGISLIVEGPVQVGAALEISLNIPGFPLGWYTTHGKVVHVKAFNMSDKTYFNIGLRYVGMNQRDYERLVAFTFSRQRKNIRQSK